MRMPRPLAQGHIIVLVASDRSVHTPIHFGNGTDGCLTRSMRWHSELARQAMLFPFRRIRK
ncbi:hypothetical protein RSP795_17915 [Ralstonia solanacearum]|uniref:Uncharacterized protein n=1 Tax=Ralstonia solanacearum CFBP2957 TaxID=859656 RepID=D8P5W1_RALSL|nr:hypothetical protein RSP795_17915 [Ralstonia solanacearum]CBJ54297.1 protein of unknown function [Ralstonia solanacearum CFBP2957]